MALSYPQKRTARRVRSYDRLRFGKSIIELLHRANVCTKGSFSISASVTYRQTLQQSGACYHPRYI